MKRTHKSSERSDEAASIKDLRLIFAKRFSEIGSEVRWCEEQTKDLPTVESGPRLNRCIVEALEKIRPLFRDFVERLYAIGHSEEEVRREAEKAWPLFNEKCAHYIDSDTLAELQRNALAEAGRIMLQKRSGFRSDPLKTRIKKLMVEFPHKSYRDILGMIGEDYEVPKQFQGHSHTVPGLVGAYDCEKCIHPMQMYLNRIRSPLGLERPSKSHRPRRP